MFSPEELQHIEELKKRYQQPQAVVLAALWMWQDKHGWVSEEGMKYVAGLLAIPYHHVFGVVTFYTMFNQKPMGRHKIEVCTNVSCMLRGCDKVISRIEEKLGIRIGESTDEARVTLVEAECLGSCGTAPMMQIGDEYYENLDESKVDAVLGGLN
ncbi:MAG: NADH-quinone oxidoreductase subunit NuoE [Ignavibacteria bacterium]|nr:NADH-quinone oxidoreductase subunit NuoE [Ignavibacteria bacterium]